MKQIVVSKDILIFAMRYALGRMTFAPTIVIENIKSNILNFTQNEIDIMIKDIEYQAGFGYGHKCDEELWLDFADYLKGAVYE